MNDTIRLQRIYFDPDDDANDGNGWNVVDDGEIGGAASRFSKASSAVFHAREIGAEFYLDDEPDPSDLVYVDGEWTTPQTNKGRR